MRRPWVYLKKNPQDSNLVEGYLMLIGKDNVMRRLVVRWGKRRKIRK